MLHLKQNVSCDYVDSGNGKTWLNEVEESWLTG